MASGAGFGEQPGDWIGPYKLMEVIGEGGFGVVWLAERREPMVQRVALKIIKPGMDSRVVIARFEQERQALAVMDHTNIAKVFDGGVIAMTNRLLIRYATVHQPLHVGHKSDLGGNEIHVKLYGTSYKLHAVWDSWLIKRNGKAWPAYAQLLESALKPADKKTWQSVTDPVKWANESFRIAKDHAYCMSSGAAIEDEDSLPPRVLRRQHRVRGRAAHQGRRAAGQQTEHHLRPSARDPVVTALRYAPARE
jgi:hypothetical protein